MATSPGLLDFIGQVKPTIDNHPTHHQTEGETIFLEGFTASGIVAFFETFFHHGIWSGECNAQNFSTVRKNRTAQALRGF
jgi:hypothetical protein